MTERQLTPMTYIFVCAGLIALTFLSVGISFLPVPGIWHIVLGLVIALGKATLVVLFFMHVLVRPRLTLLVIIVSCCWLLLLVVFTLNDYFTRGLIPFTPGH